MSDQVETNATPDPDRIEPGRAIPGEFTSPLGGRTILLIENRPFMGELFAHALQKAAGELKVRLVQNLDEGRPEAAMAVFSFIERDADPLFIHFIVQQLRVKLGGVPLFVIVDSTDPAVARIIGEAGLQGWISPSLGFDAAIAAIRQALPQSPGTEEMSRSSGGYRSQPFERAAAYPPPSHAQNDMQANISFNLTEREIDVLSLLRKGKQNKVIAHALNISESTAKVHIRNIMRKFRLRNRTEVALMCGSMDRQQVDTTSAGSD